MRSLIILEVEHGEDITDLTNLVESLRPSYFHKDYRVSILETAVRVDIPECFVLDSGH